MDFVAIDMKKASDTGAFLHLRHPSTGKLLYSDGEPVGVHVRGKESPAVQSRVKSAQRRRVTNDSDEDFGLGYLVSLVIGFENIERDGKPLEPTDESIRWFFGRSDAFGEQVLAFSQDRANFFAGGSTS